MAILHEPYAFQLLYIDRRLLFQKGRFPFPEGEDEYGFDGIVIGVKDDVSRRSRKIKPYPLSRTVSKSRTPCFRQFNNPGTFKMDVW